MGFEAAAFAIAQLVAVSGHHRTVLGLTVLAGQLTRSV
jgi:hypothetical protein